MSQSSPSSNPSATLSPADIQALKCYNACDISDALTKLHIPGGGFIPDLQPISTPPMTPSITVAPASTMAFMPKHDEPAKNQPPINFPAKTHWSDLTIPGTIVVISQPQGQSCAVLGGINAARMQKLGAIGAVVHGRVRDISQLQKSGMTIWATATSTVGSGLQSFPYAVQGPVDILVATAPRTSITVRPGDVVFVDSVNGVVLIPRDVLGEVLRILPALVEADTRCLRAVEEDMPVGEAFARFRGK